MKPGKTGWERKKKELWCYKKTGSGEARFKRHTRYQPLFELISQSMVLLLTEGSPTMNLFIRGGHLQGIPLLRAWSLIQSEM